MSGCVVQVWFEPEDPSGVRRSYFSLIETEFPDFATFCEMVEADRLIGGAILYTRVVEGHAREVIDTRPIAFRGSAVLRCQLPRCAIVMGDAA